MARFLMLLIVVVIVDAYNHHPKFPKSVASESEVQRGVKIVDCNGTHDKLRNDLIVKSSCGEPKEVFEKLTVAGSFLQVTPSHVWVKRCVGLCSYGPTGSQCTPTKTRKEHIPVRIFDLKTKRESCSTYEMVVHESCGCCVSGAKECSAPKIFNPRKCSCQCPNMNERRNCLKKRNMNMKWNRSKCTCEPRKRVTSW
ncbi:balbiani ring protein 3-like isoform X1 [Pieris napi]|uniref:balbiani ring protein 3-like isoform X1 n=1 Tax=Pieris napi TaxID=78633 RepID=UPI001FBAFAD6|nr:balbiani ring protein 3-like isoform X1 [Pieris napi]